MKILVYPEEDNERLVLIIPSKAARKPPVLVQGMSREGVKEEVGKTIAGLRGDPEAVQGVLF